MSGIQVRAVSARAANHFAPWTHFGSRFGLGRQRRRLMLPKGMASPPDHKEPVVEPPPNDDQPDDLTSRALRLRIRQQELLAELGVLALQGTKFMDILDQTARSP